MQSCQGLVDHHPAKLVPSRASLRLTFSYLQAVRLNSSELWNQVQRRPPCLRAVHEDQLERPGVRLGAQRASSRRIYTKGAAEWIDVRFYPW